MYRDIHPFSCSFPLCPDWPRTYHSRRAWIDHEFNSHRSLTEWLCVDSCGERFSDREIFVAHITTDHLKLKTTDPLDPLFRFQIDSIVNSRKQNHVDHPESAILCPFCNDQIRATRNDFQTHIGRHFIEVALQVARTTVQGNSGDVSTSRVRGPPLGDSYLAYPRDVNVDNRIG